MCIRDRISTIANKMTIFLSTLNFHFPLNPSIGDSTTYCRFVPIKNINMHNTVHIDINVITLPLYLSNNSVQPLWDKTYYYRFQYIHSIYIRNFQHFVPIFSNPSLFCSSFESSSFRCVSSIKHMIKLSLIHILISFEISLYYS